MQKIMSRMARMAIPLMLATSAAAATPAQQNPQFFSETEGCLVRDMMMMTINATGTNAGAAGQCGIPEAQIAAKYQSVTQQFKPCFAGEKITLDAWQTEYEAGRKGWLTDPGIQEMMAAAESKQATCSRVMEEFANP